MIVNMARANAGARPLTLPEARARLAVELERDGRTGFDSNEMWTALSLLMAAVGRVIFSDAPAVASQPKGH